MKQASNTKGFASVPPAAGGATVTGKSPMRTTAQSPEQSFAQKHSTMRGDVRMNKVTFSVNENARSDPNASNFSTRSPSPAKRGFTIKKNSSPDKRSFRSGGEGSGLRGRENSIGGGPSGSAAGASTTLPESIAGPTNILPHDAIKKICQEYNLTRRNVYEIHSQFLSMNMMQEDDEKAKGGDAPAESAKPQGAAASLVQKPEGIRLSFFAEHCTFLAGVLPNIKTRLFKALGIDTDNKNSVITWEQFVELYCICELG